MVSISTLWPITERNFRMLLTLPRSMPRTQDVTAEEYGRPLTGDACLAEHAARDWPTTTGMRAVTIDCPPSVTWKWLSQMMRGGGMYGWPTLEPPECCSSSVLVKNIPAPREGDRLSPLLEIRSVTPGRELVWYNMQELDLGGIGVTRLVLNYRIDPADDNRTRLICRQFCILRETTRRLLQYASRTIDFLLPAHQLMTLQRLAEHGPKQRCKPTSAPHQAVALTPVQVSRAS